MQYATHLTQTSLLLWYGLSSTRNSSRILNSSIAPQTKVMTWIMSLSAVSSKDSICHKLVTNVLKLQLKLITNVLNHATHFRQAELTKYTFCLGDPQPQLATCNLWLTHHQDKVFPALPSHDGKQSWPKQNLWSWKTNATQGLSVTVLVSSFNHRQTHFNNYDLYCSAILRCIHSWLIYVVCKLAALLYHSVSQQG